MSTIGDNSMAPERLKPFLERVERLEEEKKAIADDIKDVKVEAKGEGFDMRAFNETLKLRRLDRDERRNREALRDLYLSAAGLLD